MNIKTKNVILTIIIVISFLFLLTGCNSDNKEEDLNQKAVAEIEYLDSKFIIILNRLNNITFENYQMTAQKTELSGKSAEQEKSGSSESSSQNSKQSEESSGEGGGEASSGGEEGKEGEKSTSIIASRMSPSTILNPQTDTVDWASIKNEMENLYFAWNTIILDLYKLNIDSNDILSFSNNLDIATNYIKNEDKNNSLLAVANLYGYLPAYTEKISNDNVRKNVMQTKSYILNAYAFVAQDDWQSVQTEIAKADEVFRMVTTNVEFASKNSYKVNKTYVLLNELKNSVLRNDKEVFYIKYRNLLEEINELLVNNT